MLVILEDLDNDSDRDNSDKDEMPHQSNKIDSNIHLPPQSEIKVVIKDENKDDKSLEKDEDLNEVSLPMDDLEEMKMDIESNGFYEIYQLIDEKIKDNIIQNLQKLFNKKKIKLNMELTDIFDE